MNLASESVGEFAPWLYGLRWPVAAHQFFLISMQLTPWHVELWHDPSSERL